MKVNAVLYNRGAGGNFLARVLTLDPATVGLGGEDIETPKQRCDYYCYDVPTVAPHTHAKNGLSVWVDQELNKFYFPFTRGIEQLVALDKVVIEPIHPDHWQTKQQLLGPNDQVNLYYIDVKNCESWTKKQVAHKIYSPGHIEQGFQMQINILDSIIANTPAQAISLKNIIDSESSFLKEYERICCIMGVQFYSDLALKIYQSWRRTWAQ